MDEAARCHRVGFMRRGRIIAEDAPSQLRARLAGRILELRGSPLRLLRRVAETHEAVEAVGAFGDRLHVRVREATADSVARELLTQIEDEGGTVDYLRARPPTLEDVFIFLSERAHD
jgi:ABC-2 type transport system ATP-binding protein